MVQAYERGRGSQRQLARLFGVSVSFVQDLLRRYRRTGSVAPKPHGGGNPGKVKPYLAVAQHLHQQQSDASLAERCEQLAAAVQVRVGRTTMQRVLGQLGLTRQKRPALPQDRTPRKAAKPERRTKPSFL
ncbi:MAG TPA: helix-turn-helix domain-containing protein [Candidatus Binatia bacterium]|nr:helix-turn-helix domain-containing protein [Candidatus Binatia bacterium]